jgi:hypothetical protein
VYLGLNSLDDDSFTLLQHEFCNIYVYNSQVTSVFGVLCINPVPYLTWSIAKSEMKQ